MNLYNFLSKNIVYPFSDKILGRNITKQLNFLSKSQWWSHDKLKEFQLNKLKSIIEIAYNQVPYYKEIFSKNQLNPSDIKSIDDLKKIPILTKDDIIENFPSKIVNRNIENIPHYYSESSGSTGKQTRYFIDKSAYSLNIASYLRGWNWMGYELGDKLIKVSQNTRVSFEKAVQDYINRCKLFTQEYSDGNYEQFINLINKFSPKILRSYPDPLDFTAKYILDKKIEISGIHAINTTGNTLNDDKRKLIEQAFKAPVFDSYSTEGAAVLFECPTHDCYHLAMEYGIYEVLDNNGNEVKEGESGRLITTDLWNTSLPFIRYETKDIITKSKSTCKCGRGLESYKKILGRENDIIITKNKTILIGQSFTTYFKHIAEIKQFYINQTDINDYIFSFVLNNPLSKDKIIRIENDWKQKIGENPNIKIVIKEFIPELPSGKIRFVERNSSIDFKL
ncbi:MAG: hypothetical protein GQ564_11490 [Bacteroidales bacterium]|nr:hypothetical protein [Bacteroidales bacterium]